MRHAKAQVKGVDRAQVAQVGCAWGASIDNVFEHLKFSCHQAGGSSQAYLCAHVCTDAPVALLLNRCLCSIKCVPAFPVCLTGPTRGPLLELVRFSQIVEGRPKFRARTYIQ